MGGKRQLRLSPDHIEKLIAVDSFLRGLWLQ